MITRAREVPNCARSKNYKKPNYKKMNNRVICTALKDTKNQTVFLLFIAVLLMAAYMYFLSSAVVNVVLSREHSQNIRSVNSEITELEANYISAQHTILREVALQDGFVQVTDKTFVTEPAAILVVGRE